MSTAARQQPSARTSDRLCGDDCNLGRQVKSRLVRILHGGDDAGLHVCAGAAMQALPDQPEPQAATVRCCCVRAGIRCGNSICGRYNAA
jgi:hypothetical protein